MNNRALPSTRPDDEALHRAVALSLRTVEGCTAAGVALVRGDEIQTPVWTDPLVLMVDNLQYATEEGPCLDTIARGETFHADDLATDARWPTFGPLAAEAGIRSVLSFCLIGATAVGALNLYSSLPQAFDATGRAEGLMIAAHAGIVVAAGGELATVMRAHVLDVTKLENVYGALAARQVIGRAEGILMQREHVSADGAFDILRAASHDLDAKVGEVAQYLVATGEMPGPSASLHPTRGEASRVPGA